MMQNHVPTGSVSSQATERFDPSLRDLVIIVWQRRGIAILSFVVTLVLLFALVANWRGTYRAVAEIGLSLDAQIAGRVWTDDGAISRGVLSAQQIETTIAAIKSQQTLEAAASVLRGEGITLIAVPDDGLFAQLVAVFKQPSFEENRPASEADMVTRLRGGLDASRVGNAAVIEVGFSAAQPEIAQKALQAVIESYVWHRENQQKRTLRRQLTEAVSQFDAAQSELAVLEDDLARAQSRVGMLDADEGNRMLDRIYALDEQAEKLGQEVVALRLARENRRAAETLDDLLAIPDVAGHPTVQQLSEQLEDKKQEFAVLDQRYGPRHPRMQGKKQELDDARMALARAAETVSGSMDIALKEAEEKLHLIIAQRDQWQDRMAARTTSVQGQAALMRSVAMARTALQELGQRVQALRRALAAFHGDAEIIRAAMLPRAAEFPGKRHLSVLAIMVALFAAVVAALLRHYFDQTIDDDFDPQTHLGIPLFARIPDRRGGAGQNKTTSSLEEAAGHLAVLMRIMAQGDEGDRPDGQTGQVIAIASPVSRDGKSHITHALADKLGGLGASVIVLDADLHDPALPAHVKIDDAMRPDLSAVMSGDVVLDDVLTAAKGQDGYCYLGARMAVPGHIATGLIDRRLAEIVTHLRARFDHVIIDTPPILSVADGVVALGLADVRLFALRCGHSKRRDIAHALDQLSAAGIAPEGIVLNSAQPRVAYGKGISPTANTGQVS